MAEYKIALIGDVGVGKSSIFSRLIKGIYEENQATIGFFQDNFQIHENSEVYTITVFDTSGNPNTREFITSFIRNCHAILYVYDCMSYKSFKEIDIWHNQVAEKILFDIPLKFLIQAKSDLIPEAKNLSNYDEFMSEVNDFCTMKGLIKCDLSSKTGNGFTELKTLLIQQLVKINKVRELIPIPKPDDPNKKKSNCC